MVNLTKLNIENNPDVTDLSPLSELPNLSSLTLGYYELTSLDMLSPLTGLTKLNVYAGLPLEDISALANLTELRSLMIAIADTSWSKCAVQDLTPLSGLVNLENVNLNIDGITDFEWAKDLVNMKSLEFYSERGSYTNVDGLSGMTHLQELLLPLRYQGGANSTYDIQGLSGLTELVTLNIPCGVEDLSPLSNLTRLESLSIDGSDNVDGSFVSLEPLQNLKKLSSISLWMNGRETQPIDLSPLSGLTDLRSLTIQARHFENDPPIPSFVDLSPLSSLSNLQNLDLKVSNVVDISPLRNLTNLKSVTISEYGMQRITDWSPVDHVPNVTKG